MKLEFFDTLAKDYNLEPEIIEIFNNTLIEQSKILDKDSKFKRKKASKIKQFEYYNGMEWEQL